MKVLYIGGTGNISTASSQLAIDQGIDLYLLNRGKSGIEIPGAKTITGDIYDLDSVESALKDHKWDVVVNWIAFTPEHIKNDLRLFEGKTAQYIFISSASVYQKPPTSYLITESTPAVNPFWKYSRDKIDCENLLMQANRNSGFPVTIVRPSHTYDKVIPLSIGGWTEYTAINRLKKGEKVIIHGDGTSLWTLTHSSDFARGFNGLLGHPQSIGQTIQITSDEVLSWNQIYEITAQAAGVELNAVHIPTDFIAEIAPGEKDGLWGDKSHSAVFDNSKIKRLVPQFSCRIPYHEGIIKTIEWFESDPERTITNPNTNQMMNNIIEAYERRNN